MLSTKFEGCSPPSEILLSDANPESVLGLLSTGVWLSAAMFGNLLYLLAPLLATEFLMAAMISCGAATVIVPLHSSLAPLLASMMRNP